MNAGGTVEGIGTTQISLEKGLVTAGRKREAGGGERGPSAARGRGLRPPLAPGGTGCTSVSN